MLLFACIAFVRFVLSAQRAYDPLADAGNFGALLYMAWIPATHFGLARLWYGPQRPWLLPAIVLGSFVVLTTVFATASRASQALAIAPLLGWLLVARLRGVALRPVLLLVLTAGLAYALFYLRSPEMLVAMTDAPGAAGEIEAPDQRWVLLQSTWEALRAQGIWGSGVYTFSILYPLYRSYADQSSAGIYVHNDYAQIALEGGVWLLLPMLIVVILLALANLRSLNPRMPVAQFERVGGYWALGALFAHALVNFVFYTLGLAIAAGVAAAWAQSYRAPVPRQQDDLRGVFGWWFGWLFGLVLAAYLALDVTIYSVLSGQPGLPGTAHFRADSAAQLRFARLAETLNDDRGLPVLAQALALDAQQRAQPDSAYLKEATLATYRRALEKDVWNPDGHLFFAQFLARTGLRDANHSQESLLQQALALDSREIDTLRALAAYYDGVGESELAYAVLKREALPWLDGLATRSVPKAVALIDDLGRRAHAAGDDDVVQRLWTLRQELLARPPSSLNLIWFMQWRASRAAG